MEQDLEDYLGYIMFERRFSKNTVTSYANDLVDYQEFLKKKGIKKTKDIEREDIVAYLEELDHRKLTTMSIARKLTAIKNYHKYLYRREKIKTDVSSTVDRPKLKKSLPNVLSIEEVDKLLDIKTVTPFDYRNKAMLELIYGTGLRISELINLKLEDIDFENCVIRCFGKGSKERIIPIGEYILDSLNEYLTYRPQLAKNKRCDYLFLNNRGSQYGRISFFKLIKKLLKEKNIHKEVSPHSLRHSFATHMIEGGADLRSVQELLGHANISTTTIYTHISNQQVKKDYKEYHPRSEK